ncbi:MAG: patatin-like phospholipase RssA [Gammaproteobacteria bacterium]|nr:patatin-like phospholipase RssA [Gammaproteobacteria bacterium]
MSSNKRQANPGTPRIGLALGGGGARGWAHIGVLRKLEQCGIHPDIICGTSIGALVGAAYASDQLDTLENWIRQLKWREVVSLLDFSFSGGVIAGEKLFEFLGKHLRDCDIDDLSRPYAAVATQLGNGQEIWLRSGSIMKATRASVALPGIFTPVTYRGGWLVDGGLVNPVPVSVCRALGADIVIAVALTTPRTALRYEPLPQDEPDKPEPKGFIDRVRQLFAETGNGDIDSPSLVDVVIDSIDIMQQRIMRSRMAGDPPEILIRPQTSAIGFLEFYRGNEAIDAGIAAAAKAQNELQQAFASSLCEPPD